MGCVSSKGDEQIRVTSPDTNEAPVQPNEVKLQSGSASDKTKDGKRRVGVSAEASGAGGAPYKKVVHAKPEEASARLRATISKSPLFESIGEEQMNDVVEAMFEVEKSAGEVVIQQGDPGDNFYVVASGTYSAYLKQVEGPVKKYEASGENTFGELSLMYNSLRAATIKCDTAGALWALDRATFRQIVMEANKATMSTASQVAPEPHARPDKRVTSPFPLITTPYPFPEPLTQTTSTILPPPPMALPCALRSSSRPSASSHR